MEQVFAPRVPCAVLSPCGNQSPLEIRAFLRCVERRERQTLTEQCYVAPMGCHARFQKGRSGSWGSHRYGCRAHRRSPPVFLLDCMLSGLETVPLQSRVASRTNMDEHFISAEECLRLFPKKLKESFRVTCGSLHCSPSKAPPCSPPHSSHMHEF